MPATKMPSPISQSPLGGVLSGQALLVAGSEHVGDRLVECTRLVAIDEADGVLGDGVAELVGEHVGTLGETLEDRAVTVAEDQLVAIPEGVVVGLAVVDGDDDRCTRSVVGVALERRGEHLQRPLDAVRRLVDSDVARRGLARSPHRIARQRRAAGGVVDRPRRDVGRSRGGRAPLDGARVATSPQLLVCRECVGGAEPLEEVGRDEGAWGPRGVHVSGLPVSTDSARRRRLIAGSLGIRGSAPYAGSLEPRRTRAASRT